MDTPSPRRPPQPISAPIASPSTHLPARRGALWAYSADSVTRLDHSVAICYARGPLLRRPWRYLSRRAPLLSDRRLLLGHLAGTAIARDRRLLLGRLGAPVAGRPAVLAPPVAGHRLHLRRG